MVGLLSFSLETNQKRVTSGGFSFSQSHFYRMGFQSLAKSAKNPLQGALRSLGLGRVPGGRHGQRPHAAHADRAPAAVQRLHELRGARSGGRPGRPGKRAGWWWLWRVAWLWADMANQGGFQVCKKTQRRQRDVRGWFRFSKMPSKHDAKCKRRPTRVGLGHPNKPALH